ncbi:hypothetical protein COS66_02520 [Candidatus Berkelbacteria bacterium CG06_land_8_20_14_3_00_43_10]|nr:MAG: hypothetical protein AUK41_00110 [Candidatus Berkelbacteria bacterium CG2_30_43_20]PIU87122.1 MAG: hypothetical protein COS66_02520 [Candidatus Berkelbacteria bacterium CG06_land_8_20_14_3_00_43_10]
MQLTIKNRKYTHWIQKTATWLAIIGLVIPLNLFPQSALAVSGTQYVATTGNDTTGNGTSGNPYLTIQKAIDVASSGDTISIAAGTYVESPNVTKPLTVTGAGQSQTTIAPTANSDGVTINSSTVTMQDLKIQTSNALATPNIAVKINASDGVTLTNDTIATTGDKAMGVWVGGSSNGISPSSNLTITKSTITIAGVATGIYAAESTPAHSGWTIGGSAINANTITASVGNPIEFYDVTGSQVSYNTLNATTESSLIWSSELSNISNLTVSGNTFNGSGGSELAILNDFPTNTAPATTVTTVNLNSNIFNTWGSRAVRIGGSVSGVTLSTNQFLKSPVGEAVKNENTSATITATQNWWGSTSGPNHSTNLTGTGNSVTDFVTFRPWCNSSACTSNDSTAPTATLTYSKDGGTTYTSSVAAKDADTLRIKATFNENVEDTTGVSVAIDNSVLSTMGMTIVSGTVYTYDLNVPVGNIATATVSLSSVYDTSGNALASAPANNTFTIDNTNPGLATLIIEDLNSDSADDDMASSKLVRLSWNASSESGSGISHYLLRVRQTSSNGTIVSGLDDLDIGNVTSYTLTSGQGDLITSDGFYVFGLRAVDNAGNMSASYAYSDGITIDTSVPTVNAGSDKTINAIFTQDATVNGAVAGVASYQWSKQTGPGTITFGSSTAEDTTISANQDGTYTIRLTVVDNAGNTAFDEMSLIWDTTKPASTVTTSGIYGPNTWGGSVAGSASDTLSGIASVNVKIINPSGDVFNGTTFVPSGAGVTASGTTSWTSAITSAQLAAGGQGVYTIQSRATDNAGNTESTGTSTITWDSIVPNTPVINSVTSPVNSASQTVTGTAESGSTVNITGGSAPASGTATGGNYSILVSLTQDATNNLSVTATDGAGNNTTSSIQTIIVTDNDAPTTPTIGINTGATYTNQLSSSLALSATDNIGVNQVRFSEDPTLTDAAYSAIASPLGYTLSSGDGTKTVYAQFKDIAGNESAIASDTIVLDRTTPTLTVSSPIDGQVFKNDSPSASYSATDTNSLTYEVRVDDMVVLGHMSGSPLGTLTDGDHTVIVKATDSAGNETSIARTITINSLLTSEPLTTQFIGIQSNQTINDIANTGIELSGINTTGDVTFSIGEYAGNPTSEGITGMQAFGKYFDVSVSDSTKVTFPIMVKIYYTNADLAGAGISEDKLDGIYFYNTVSGAWERYADSGVQTSDLVADGISFAGYVWANVNHLTPIVAASDTTPPVVPTSVTTLTGDSTLSLSWNAITGASGYTVRWRPTTTGVGGYTYATTTGTNYQISGLNNDWSYEIGVASADTHGNMSDYTVVSATPLVPITLEQIKQSVTPAVVLASTQIAEPVVQPQQTISTPTPTTATTPEPQPSDADGAIKGTETSQESGSQAIVVFAILLLALAAGIGGYYGYEWFVQRPSADGGPVFDAKQKKGSDTTPVQPAGRGRPKKNDTSRDGRW